VIGISAVIAFATAGLGVLIQTPEKMEPPLAEKTGQVQAGSHEEQKPEMDAEDKQEDALDA
jgi:hypothetical protein